MRYFLELAYNGKAYHGWQIQPDAISVQETLERALYTILQAEIAVVGAGRTDTGVHATQYYVHFDSGEIVNKGNLIYKLNSILPADIAVFRIFEVPADAHARFDALSRSYQYHVIQRKDPFLYEKAYFLKNDLNVEEMNRAAGVLKNYKDFKCFSKSRTDVKTYNCDIKKAVWEVLEDRLVFHITADRFLRNMVRAVVGTLLEVGLGKIEVEDIHKIIKSRDRQNAGTSVPARGLYLTGIDYPDSIVKK